MSATPGPVSPGGVVGILGGGQLGRMLCLAAARLGLRTHVFCTTEAEPAAQVASMATFADFTDRKALREFASVCDVVTTEFENVPVDALDVIARSTAVAPPSLALQVAQDRLTEKTFISNLGIPVAPFAAVESGADLVEATAMFGGPSILKTRRFGYDGKGQVRLSGPVGDAQAEAALVEIGGAQAIVEQMVSFDHEISAVLVRDVAGNCAAYDPPRNEHRDGVLHVSSVPAHTPVARLDQAVEHARTIAEALDYVGVLAVEFFVVDGAALVVNEIAPRVHNSGHWTIDACMVSQFENHIRAVARWSLGSTERHSDAVMTNLIGDEIDGIAVWAKRSDVAVHHYGKADTRAGRKMGHVTELRPRR